MEPVTHLLTGACLGRAGFNRTTAYATLAMVLGAEAPDIDMLWNIRGPVAGLEHHRGITHTFLGAPFMALLVTAAVWLWHRSRTRSATPAVAAKRTTSRQKAPPVRWVWLWCFALIADLSHILLDWTNTYGVRPFFPFNPHWYAGNIFFLFEPVLFAALLAALVVPALLGLADREIGVRRSLFRGRGWAIFALCVAVVLGCWKWAEHERALGLLAQQNYQNEPPIRMTVSPYPGDVFHWFGVVETKDFFQTANLNTRTDEFTSQAPGNMYYKQPQTPAILTAEGSWLGRVYLDWSKFPFVQQSVNFGMYSRHALDTKVRFQDLRFAYNALFVRGRQDNPLRGTVIVAPDGQVEEMRMGNRIQK